MEQGGNPCSPVQILSLQTQCSVHWRRDCVASLAMDAGVIEGRKCRICREYGHRADNRAFHPQEAAFRGSDLAAKRRRSEGGDDSSNSDEEFSANAAGQGRACSLCNCYGHRADNKRFHPDALPDMPHEYPNTVMLPTSSVMPQHDTGCDPQLRCKDSPDGLSICAVVQELLALQKPYRDENGVLVRQYARIADSLALL